MDCPDCGDALVAFAVPPVARDAAPGDPAAICPHCLGLVAVDAADADPDFDRIIEGFPDGERGAVMAVAVGLLVDSVALNRRAVLSLFDAVSEAGEDPWLTLERLAVAPRVDPGVDLGRARRQLEQLSG